MVKFGGRNKAKLLYLKNHSIIYYITLKEAKEYI